MSTSDQSPLNTLTAHLSNPISAPALFTIYKQHFELFKRNLITFQLFEDGIKKIYPIIDGPELQAADVQLLEYPLQMNPLNTRYDYFRLVEAVKAVNNRGGNKEFLRC
jgi:hypothetical protein